MLSLTQRLIGVFFSFAFCVVVVSANGLCSAATSRPRRSAPAAVSQYESGRSLHLLSALPFAVFLQEQCVYVCVKCKPGQQRRLVVYCDSFVRPSPLSSSSSATRQKPNGNYIKPTGEHAFPIVPDTFAIRGPFGCASPPPAQCSRMICSPF